MFKMNKSVSLYSRVFNKKKTIWLEDNQNFCFICFFFNISSKKIKNKLSCFFCLYFLKNRKKFVFICFEKKMFNKKDKKKKVFKSVFFFKKLRLKFKEKKYK